MRDAVNMSEEVSGLNSSPLPQPLKGTRQGKGKKWGGEGGGRKGDMFDHHLLRAFDLILFALLLCEILFRDTRGMRGVVE